MRVMIIGGDGYCGWATSLHLSARGHQVAIFDSLVRRHWDQQLGVDTLTPSSPSHGAPGPLAGAKQGKTIALYVGDTNHYESLSKAVREFAPEAIVHFGEQRSAPYSMISREHAVLTQSNNVIGTLNLLYAMRDFVPNCHLVKLGTMGSTAAPTSTSKGLHHHRAQRAQGHAAVPQTAELLLSPEQGPRQPQHRLCLSRVEAAPPT